LTVIEPPPPSADDVAARPNEPESSPSDEALALASRAIEAIVLVATDPIPDQLLAQVLELPVPTVRRLCDELAESYRDAGRGFQFAEVAGGWRYQTHPDLAPYIEKYVLEGQTARLSSAALETLSIVAYKQPLSRGQMSAIRGVNVDGVLRTLVQRGYVEEIGKDAGPGQATLFGTTQLFLERLGLASIDDLPPLGEFVPDAGVVEALEMTLRVAPDDPRLPLEKDSSVDPGSPDPGSSNTAS
jgi:segregation and condensation protein B